MPSIPRVIHQTWRSHDLPDDLRRFQVSWKTHHPGWDYRFYDDEGCRSFVKTSWPALLPAYDAYPSHIQRVDLFRYLVVSQVGGIYADLDIECFRPIGRLLEGKECVFSIEAHVTKLRQQELGYREPYQIGNCIFASVPNHRFLLSITQRTRELVNRPVATDDDVEDTTGPRMLTRLYYGLSVKEREGIHVLPQIFLLSPKEYPNVFPFNLNTYGRHYCRGTWKTRRSKATWRRRWIERNRLPAFW